MDLARVLKSLRNLKILFLAGNKQKKAELELELANIIAVDSEDDKQVAMHQVVDFAV